MDRLRIAVVGVGSATGARSSSHLDVIARLSDKYELCALCDVDRDRLQAAGEHYGVRALYTNLDAMLAQEHPDVAYRLTPTDSTTMVCLQVAEAGVHLINEIPIASTLPQADAIIEACERNNVKLEVAENGLTCSAVSQWAMLDGRWNRDSAPTPGRNPGPGSVRHGRSFPYRAFHIEVRV